MNPDDVFTFEELRIALTAFAIWLCEDGPGEGREAALVDQFLEETL